MRLVEQSLNVLGVQCKMGVPTDDGQHLRIGGVDARKEVYKGWIHLEKFVHRNSEGSFCVMQRDTVCLLLLKR